MKYSALLLSAVLLFGAGSARADVVTNGSFEQGTLGIGSFQGWQTTLGDISTYVDSSGVTGPVYGDAYDGLWAAYFGSIAADGGASISQNLATQAGAIYSLTFELANDNGGLPAANAFTVTVGTAQAYSFTNLADQSYAGYQFNFTASGASTALIFFGSNENSYFELDYVGVTAVPEPATLALVLSGVLGMVLLRRLRSRFGKAEWASCLAA